MSLAVLYSRSLVGVDAPLVTVEVHLANGLPSFTIVGLPEAEVKESKDRVRAALVNCRFDFPARRITVNLAPADLPKESGRFDLPIALGILAASGQIPANRLNELEFAGELSLSGELRAIRGALAMTFGAHRSGRAFVVPAASADEAALVRDATVHGVETLLELCKALIGCEPLPRHVSNLQANPLVYPDLIEVRGQVAAKRALEVVAAGRHSLIMVGAPGTGKSMLAHRLVGILPDMTDAEALEAASLQSLARVGFRTEEWRRRPFRAPHHSASSVSLVGGGANARPGEISLAHHGVLFLDELPEFDRKVLEVLREPLEAGRVNISRAARQASYPAQFQLVGALNPCPCGYQGHHSGRCRCTPDQVQRYRGRISGPLLDRIDVQIEVPALPESDLSQTSGGETSAAVRARVQATHNRQLTRQGKANALLGVKELDDVCVLEPAAKDMLGRAFGRLNLSARAYHRVIKVARTIADMAMSDVIRVVHIAESLQYRRLDRGL
ncbi:MAG: YifB family Mg chelatase-like AAA ATPase [Burkholderiales bacterium]